MPLQLYFKTLLCAVECGDSYSTRPQHICLPWAGQHSSVIGKSLQNTVLAFRHEKNFVLIKLHQVTAGCSVTDDDRFILIIFYDRTYEFMWLLCSPIPASHNLPRVGQCLPITGKSIMNITLFVHGRSSRYKLCFNYNCANFRRTDNLLRFNKLKKCLSLPT
jgi:hypothetical protein